MAKRASAFRHPYEFAAEVKSQTPLGAMVVEWYSAHRGYRVKSAMVYLYIWALLNQIVKMKSQFLKEIPVDHITDLHCTLANEPADHIHKTSKIRRSGAQPGINSPRISICDLSFQWPIESVDLVRSVGRQSPNLDPEKDGDGGMVARWL